MVVLISWWRLLCEAQAILDLHVQHMVHKFLFLTREHLLVFNLYNPV